MRLNVEKTAYTKVCLVRVSVLRNILKNVEIGASRRIPPIMNAKGSAFPRKCPVKANAWIPKHMHARVSV
jgi:hypothetical protein